MGRQEWIREWMRRGWGQHKVTEGVFVLVALDEDGQPLAVEKG